MAEKKLSRLYNMFPTFEMRTFLKFSKILIVLMLLFFTASCGSKVTSAFLAISDIHFNPFDTCQVDKAPCLIIHKLQAAPAEQWARIFQRYGSPLPSHTGADANAALLSSTLAQVNKLPKTYHFVIIDGDFLAHNFQSNFKKFSGDTSQEDYKQFVNKTYQYLQEQFQQAFPGMPVYIALGNNDSYDGDFYSYPNGRFYKDMAQLWQRMIPDTANRSSFEQTFPEAGYYAVTSPTKTKQTNRILFLNTVLFSANVAGPDTNLAAQQELDWLQQQLQRAKQNKQRVWLVYHIPDGVDVYSTVTSDDITMLWQPQYSAIFLKLLNQYPDIIAALISSHIHMDGVQLIHLQNRSRLLNTFLPSVSPIYGNNPAFKVYEYYPHSMKLQNFQTYYLNESTDKWGLEYDFNKVYQPYCHPCHVLNGYSTINQTNWRAEQYKKYYGVSTDSQSITQGDWVPYYWCAINNQTKENYRACVDSVNAVKPRGV